RLAVEAAARGAGDEGALLAALLGERDVRERWNRDRRSAPATGPSDLLELASLFEEAARAGFEPERVRRLGLSPGAVASVERSRRQLQRILKREQTATPTAASTANLTPNPTANLTPNPTATSTPDPTATSTPTLPG